MYIPYHNMHNIHTYINACMHTNKQTNIHTYIHSLYYIQTHIRTYATDNHLVNPPLQCVTLRGKMLCHKTNENL